MNNLFQVKDTNNCVLYVDYIFIWYNAKFDNFIAGFYMLLVWICSVCFNSKVFEESYLISTFEYVRRNKFWQYVTKWYSTNMNLLSFRRSFFVVQPLHFIQFQALSSIVGFIQWTCQILQFSQTLCMLDIWRCVLMSRHCNSWSKRTSWSSVFLFRDMHEAIVLNRRLPMRRNRAFAFNNACFAGSRFSSYARWFRFCQWNLW